MGRLLDTLNANAGNAPPAITAIPAIQSPEAKASEAENRRIATNAAAPLSKDHGKASPDFAQQTARLLGMLHAEFLPQSLLARDDAKPEELAAMDSVQLRVYARALHRSATLDAGTVPAEYTKATRCEGCGPVWLWEGCPPMVKACPWCFRRTAGRRFPRPMVTCGDCAHFRPDTINPPGGVGACRLGIEQRAGEPTRYPFAPRECGEHWSNNDDKTAERHG